MSLPHPEQGARIVLQRAVTVLKDGLAAAVSAINVRLETEGAGYTLAAPIPQEVKPHEMPGVWPSAYPAVRLRRATSSALPLLGGLGVRDETVQLIARCYVRRPHGRASVTADYDLSDLNAEAWDFASAVRQVLERDLPDAGTGIWNVTVTQQRESDPVAQGSDDRHYVLITELTLAVLQRVRENFGTTP